MADALLHSTLFKCLYSATLPSLSTPPPQLTALDILAFLSVQILALGCCVVVLTHSISHRFL